MAKEQNKIPQAAAKAAFLQAMVKSFGNVSASAKAVGVSRATPYLWAKEDPEFKEAMESIDYQEAYMDAIEQKLAKLGLIDENPTVLIFLAKTKAKSRGYIETSESKHSGIPGNITINVTSKENASKLQEFITNGGKLN
jgi:hypothetical protein